MPIIEPSPLTGTARVGGRRVVLTSRTSLEIPLEISLEISLEYEPRLGMRLGLLRECCEGLGAARMADHGGRGLEDQSSSRRKRW